MTDLARFGSISQQAATVAASTAPRPASQQNSRRPYATLVAILTIASTLIAFFDLFLFGTGVK